MNLAIHAKLAYPSRNKLRILRAEIEDYYGFVVQRNRSLTVKEEIITGMIEKVRTGSGSDRVPVRRQQESVIIVPGSD